MKAVHFMVGRLGAIACGYHRWGSMDLTATRSRAGVTCRRPGCRQDDLPLTEVLP